jgi:hypothetical protein
MRIGSLEANGLQRRRTDEILRQAGSFYLRDWQLESLKFAILVFQLIELPVCLEAKYSFTYQKVQSSTGSTVMLE